MPANGRSCGSCSNFEHDPSMPGTGECRASLPEMDMMPVTDEQLQDVDTGSGAIITITSVEQVDVTRRAIWPRVYVDMWCAEYQSS